MSFTALNSSEIAASKPTKQELFQKIKDNFDDHESRITTVEGATQSFRPLEYAVFGDYWRFGGSQTEIMLDRMNLNITLTAARLLIKSAGTSGTTEVDVLYKRGVGAWTSIFSTKPSVVYSAGNYAISTNAILSTTALLAGDLLRIDITSVQSQTNGFILQLEYEKT
jgi:hypothetical protein